MCVSYGISLCLYEIRIYLFGLFTFAKLTDNSIYQYNAQQSQIPYNLENKTIFLIRQTTSNTKRYTGCVEKILTLQNVYILFRVVWIPQRRVIRRSNGNFVGFPRIILKIVKNYPMKHNLHFSGKWQNRQTKSSLWQNGL